MNEQLGSELAKMSVVFLLMAAAVRYLYLENKELKRRLEQKEDYILQENRANLNIIGSCLKLLEKLDAFVIKHSTHADEILQESKEMLTELKRIHKKNGS